MMNPESVVAEEVLTGAALVASALVVPATAGAQQAGSTATSSAADVRFSVLAADSAGEWRPRPQRYAPPVVGWWRPTAEVGLLAVDAPDQGFVAAESSRSSAVAGVARQRVVGHSPDAQPTASQVAQVEQENRTAEDRANGQAGRAAAAPGQNKHAPSTTAGMESLDDQLWALRIVRSDLAWATRPRGASASPSGSWTPGIDLKQPRHRTKLRRSTVAQLPRGHARHRRAVRVRRAGRPGQLGRRRSRYARRRHDRAAANGFGLSGVAPNVSLVNIRAGQDSGFFSCSDRRRTDIRGQRRDRRREHVVLRGPVAVQLQREPGGLAGAAARAADHRHGDEPLFDYAHRNGVTLISALGNEHSDLGHPGLDATSPDFPIGDAYDRTIDNATCLSMPTEGPHVIGVCSLGPSGRKSDFSNSGNEQPDVSAPGGWFRDGLGTPSLRANGNLILSSYPVNVLQAEGQVDADGNMTAGRDRPGHAEGCTRPQPTTATTRSCRARRWRPRTRSGRRRADRVAVGATRRKLQGRVPDEPDPDETPAPPHRSRPRLPCRRGAVLHRRRTGTPTSATTCEGDHGAQRLLR